MFLMQLGFFLVEIGQVRKRNQMNMISMKFISLMVSAIIFYLMGYTMSNNANGGILGQYYNNYHDTTASDDLDWFYKFSMCSICVTILSGCLAERM